MTDRWLILISLTFARATMGFQFQSLAALGPLIVVETGIEYTGLGVLIGIYLLPGTLIALPGGWLGRRFGDKRVVVTGLALMTVGGATALVSNAYPVLFVGRLVSGIGAVLLNVLVTKMVTDWFVGRRLVTAMGILVSSWPLGIAIALLLLPGLGSSVGLEAALVVPVVACAVALAIVAMVYRAPPATRHDDATTNLPVASTGISPRMSGSEIRGVLTSGSAWCCYNVAFIVPLGFGVDFLTEGGTDAIKAGAVVSLASWLLIPSLLFGGWFADHFDRPVATMAGGFLLMAAILWWIPVAGAPGVWFLALGVVMGPPAGAIMSLPGRALRPESRSIGMGIFFSIYYAGMGVCPALAGFLRDWSGDPGMPMWFGGIMAVIALLSMILFERTSHQRKCPAG